jgi:hypothetical protein
LAVVSSRAGGEGVRLSSRAVSWLATGLAGGFFSGLVGVGGGIVMVPLLVSRLRLSQHRAHGTSLAIIILVGASGFLGYWLRGHVDWGLVVWLAIGSALGAYLGAHTMARVPERSLRAMFGVFMLIVAARLFVT